MKLYGIWVAQNEGDIIRETLEFLRKKKYYEKIFFFDLGSEDNTFDIAREYQDILTAQQIKVPYSGALRCDLIKQHHSFYKDGDWIAIIDSDEFYAEDPRLIIEQAEQENAFRIETWQINHYFTDVDLKNWEREDPERPITERRLYYLINWSEQRFYKFVPPERSGGTCIAYEGKYCSRRLLNSHYPYRTPAQMKKKIDLRLRNRKAGGTTQYHIFSNNWQNFVVDHNLLHKFDGEYKFTPPHHVCWKKYYNFWDNTSTGWSNPVYNNVSIHWLMSHGLIRQWTPFERVLHAAGKIVQLVRGKSNARAR